MHPASTPSSATRSASARVVAYGAHLPLIAFDGVPPTLARLRDYVRQAAALGYRYLCANDHLLFQRPWLDGPTALAATLDAGAGMTAVTTIALPVIRGPVQTAKLLTALDLLTDGALIAGVGPGILAARLRRRRRAVRSSAGSRFDEAVRGAAGAARRGRAAVRGRLLLDCRPEPRTPSGATRGTAPVARQLGVGGGHAPRRSPRRRLAGLRLQHDAGRFPPRRRRARASTPGSERRSRTPSPRHGST